MDKVDRGNLKDPGTGRDEGGKLESVDELLVVPSPLPSGSVDGQLVISSPLQSDTWVNKRTKDEAEESLRSQLRERMEAMQHDLECEMKEILHKTIHAGKEIGTSIREEDFEDDGIEELEQGKRRKILYDLGAKKSLLSSNQFRNNESSYTWDDDGDSTSDILFLKGEVKRMKITMNEMKKEQTASIEERKGQTILIEELRSLVVRSNTDDQPLNYQPIMRMSMLGRTPSAVLGPHHEISLDEDTFSLMMISKVGTKSWILGFSSFSFQMTLGFMIAIGQFNESDDSSIFGVPFKVNGPSVRVTQFLSLILCLSTQSDILTSIRSFFLLGKGSNWSDIIGEERSRASRSLWIVRVGLPNTLKLSQGLVVTFTSFVIIVQNKGTIDLLKDFTSLMIISEFDNILFYLAAYGYLGEELHLQAVKIRKKTATPDIMLSTHETTRRVRPNGLRFVRLVFVALLSAMFAGWGLILHMQRNGEIFDKEFPGCGQEHYELAFNKFGDGKCYGGPFNTINCKYEDGDCDNFNTAFPSCNGEDIAHLHNVEEEVGNTICNMAFSIPQCEYDGGDCCPYNVHLSILFGDGKCNGGLFNTEGCLFDFGDCDSFNRAYPNCTLDDSFLTSSSADIILGNDICEGSGYNVDECGYEFGDCDKAQIAGDIVLSGVLAPSSKCIDFDMKMSDDGFKILVNMHHTNQVGNYDKTSNGKIAGYSYNETIFSWMRDETTDKERSDGGVSVTMNGNGSVVVIWSTWFYAPTSVEIMDFWGRYGEYQTIDSGLKVDLTADGLRIAISRFHGTGGKIEFYQKNHQEDLWNVGGTIYGSAKSEIGIHYLRINSLDGTRVFCSVGPHGKALRTYHLNSTSQEWFQAGSDFIGHHKNDDIAISADGNRFASSFNSTNQSDVAGKVKVYEWKLDPSLNGEGSWNQLGPSISSNENNGFGRSISMNTDGTVLAISAVDPKCDGLNPFEVENDIIVAGALTDLCPTGEIQLYNYKPTNPPHRPFSQLPHIRDVNSQSIMEKQKQVTDNTILGLQISLSGDSSILTASGYDLGLDFGFVKSYNVTELFYIDCIVKAPEKIGNGVCDDYEPYYTEECGYDGGDCPPPFPVLGYNNCEVAFPEKVSDGYCEDWLPYNSEQCNHDGGDCALPSPIKGSPDCFVSNPWIIRDSHCHDYLPYNSYECGFDGTDCLPSDVASNTSPIIISEIYNERNPSKSWRLWAHANHTVAGWSWDIGLINFYSSIDCSSDMIPSDGSIFDSGNAGSTWSSELAFKDGGGEWGGRPQNDEFYIGMTFSTAKKIQCIEVTNANSVGKAVHEMRIQAFNETDSTWENAFIAKDLDLAASAVNRIKLVYELTSSPSTEPSVSFSPSVSPSLSTEPSTSAMPTPFTVVVNLELLTDKDPAETSWSIVDIIQNDVVVFGPAEDETYEASVLYNLSLNVIPCTSYNFTIIDSYGDGLWSPPGYAKLKYGEEILGSIEGDFGSEGTISFNICDEDDEDSS